MTIAEITEKMIVYSNGNLHDISHFLKVYAYAKTIGEQEALPKQQQFTLEAAALMHDIACPLCRKKYGNTNGKYQELEGENLAEEFLRDMDLPLREQKRIVYLVAHHHTWTNIDGLDYQILLEADYLVNADESGYSKEQVKNTLQNLFQTKTGSAFLKSIYGV